MIEIRNRAGAVLHEVDAETLRLADLRGADLRGAVLRRAVLCGADLYCANLSGADLTGAKLAGADLRSVSLTGANLTNANLRRADLYCADLSGANLRGADLTGAALDGVDLTEATLPNGEAFEQFVNVTVPRLLRRERPDRYAAAVAAWDCHEWANCPLHVARGVSTVQELPEAERPRANLFLALFDGRALPRPEVTP